jgi:long-chain acyl-CoA synthetase
LSVGGTIVFVDGYGQQQVLFNKIKEYGVTSMGLVPAAWQTIYALSKEKIGEFSHQIKLIEFGSSFLDNDHKQLLTKLLPQTKICMNFGLTESPRSFFQDFSTDSEYLNSIGLPSPDLQVSIRNEMGKEIEKLEEVGEICVRSQFVMDGYWNNYSETNIAFFGEWFRTGEIGYSNSKGYYFVKGRSKEIINVGGFKVAPKELEDILIKMDEIADLACTKVPDKITGEAVALFVVVKKEASLTKVQIKTYLKGKVEPYKMPTYIEFVKSVPRAESGKIQRQFLTPRNG